MRLPALGSIVCVEWDDAWIDTAESRPELWSDSAPIATYGILTRVGSVVSVAAEKTSDKDYRLVVHIPNRLIRKCTTLRGAKS